MPVPVAHVFLVQTVSALASHVTIVAGLTLQLYGNAALSQNRVPSQKLPFSWPAQSALVAQPHVLVPLLQVPVAQTSPLVQGLPSSQLTALLACAHPVAGTQLSVVHGLPSSHRIATLTAVPAHEPLEHRSFCVHALLSLQLSVLTALTQPFFGSQLSVVHTLLSLQLSAAPPHTPPAHTSLALHALPSSQLRVLLAKRQLPLALSQESLVQALPSAQTLVAPGTQPAETHWSPTVHALPSVHGEALALCTQPVSLSQESSVQGLPSSQLRPAPAEHTPFTHVSLVVHTLPSASHGLPAFWLT